MQLNRFKFLPQVLAIFAVVGLSFFHGPDVYTEFLVRRVTGYSGAFEIGLAFATYVAGIIFLLCLINPKARAAFLLNHKTNAVKTISTVIILGYVLWGSFMLYSFSQATDL